MVFSCDFEHAPCGDACVRPIDRYTCPIDRFIFHMAAPRARVRSSRGGVRDRGLNQLASYEKESRTCSQRVAHLARLS